VRDELEALLRAVAFGEDSSVSVDHRLRAAEQLRALGVGDDEPYRWERELVDMSDQEIQAHTDRMTAALFMLADDDELRERWPETWRAIRRAVDERLELAER
jgi:hypothetical protein